MYAYCMTPRALKCVFCMSASSVYFNQSSAFHALRKGGGRLIFGYWYKIFGFWTNNQVLDKIPGFGTKSLGPWTNPWSLDKIKIKRFKLRGGYRLKIENPDSVGSVPYSMGYPLVERSFIKLLFKNSSTTCNFIISYQINLTLYIAVGAMMVKWVNYGILQANDLGSRPWPLTT